jgi:hypothetical protein
MNLSQLCPRFYELVLSIYAIDKINEKTLTEIQLEKFFFGITRPVTPP